MSLRTVRRMINRDLRIEHSERDFGAPGISRTLFKYAGKLVRTAGKQKNAGAGFVSWIFGAPNACGHGFSRLQVDCVRCAESTRVDELRGRAFTHEGIHLCNQVSRSSVLYLHA